MVAAVVAAMTAQSVYAGATVQVDEVMNVPAGESSAIVSDTTRPAIYSAIAKDGEGSAVVVGNVTKYSAIYVREGELQVGDGTTPTSFVISASQATDAQDVYDVGLCVSGKDAVVTFNNATYTNINSVSSQEHFTQVGGSDGNGIMNITNGSNLNLISNSNFFIGNSLYANETTAAPGSSALYQGNYTPAAGNSDVKFGKGIVNVSGGSTLSTGYHNFWMSEGELNVDGAGSVVNVCNYSGNRTILALEEYSTSTLNVTNGGKLVLNSSSLATTWASNGTTNINVVGEGSELLRPNARPVHPDTPGSPSGQTSTEISGGGKNSTTNIYVADGGKLSMLSDVTNFATNAGSNRTANMTVGSGGAAEFKDVMMGSGTTVSNSGDIAAEMVYVGEGAEVGMASSDASFTADSMIVDGTLAVENGASATMDVADLFITENGVLSLNDGSTLNVTGSLTMDVGSVILVTGSYDAGDVVLSATGDMDIEGVTITFADGKVQYELQNGQLVVTAAFDQAVADSLTLGNWGIATASRTFVNAVRGQRTNTGCIADGRGTVWAAVLGATNDIAGSDINLKGAAFGADMKVGEKSSVGIALGYTDADVKPTGLQTVEQQGIYVALYGEHALRKLSSTSCLSLDWVAAYGNTESDVQGMDWEQNSLQLNTRLNWNKKLTDKLCMSVFGGLEYFATDSDTVDGVKTGSVQNLRGELGVGASYVAWGAPDVYDGKGGLVSPGCRKLVLHGEIRYMNDMVRSNPVVRMDGMSGGSLNPGRQGMGVEAGATYRFNERWSASANYGFNAMDDSREHRVNIGAGYTF